MNLLEKAKISIIKDDCNLAVLKDDSSYFSSEHGIGTLLKLINESPSILKGSYTADSVVGKAAAFLMIKGEIKELYAQIISEHAADVLEKYNIPFSYGEIVPHIINRAGDGMCPMEQKVLNIDNPHDAYILLDCGC